MSQITVFDTAGIANDISQFTVENPADPTVVTPTGGGNITIPDSSSIVVTGSANTMTFSLAPEFFTSMSVQTTDASVTAMAPSITIPASSAWTVEALVIAAEDDYSRSFSSRLWTGVRRGAAGAPVRLSVMRGKDQDPAGDLNVSWILNGNDLELQVSGEAGSTINWLAYVRYVKLGA